MIGRNETDADIAPIAESQYCSDAGLHRHRNDVFV